MTKIVYANRYNSSVLSLNLISRFLEIIILVFLTIFILGPAVFFIICGLLCAILFFRPYFRPLYEAYKFIFRLKDYEFYMQGIPLNIGFWFSRSIMAIIVIGQIGIGIYFLIRFGFLEQNLIHAILQQ
ncbi:MAG: hypothetical protein WBV22_11925 [Anaerolineaceae bacterium]